MHIPLTLMKYKSQNTRDFLILRYNFYRNERSFSVTKSLGLCQREGIDNQYDMTRMTDEEFEVTYKDAPRTDLTKERIIVPKEQMAEPDAVQQRLFPEDRYFE